VRLFAGIFPPPEAVTHLASMVERLGLTKRVIPRERWHITLAFVADGVPDAALAALDAVSVPLGRLGLRGGGHFGPILWAGVSGDVDGLVKLSRAIRREMRARRLDTDDKRFRAHMTIARSPAATTLLREYEGPMWTPHEVVLIHSEMGPQPVYHRLGTYPLPGPGLGAGAAVADGRE
jgi:RNA 2',3'-cyclic 3'-phosphodiesterase